MQRGPVSILCNISTFYENVCSQTSFYILVNQIVCVDAKCTCLALAMLHMAVITKNILKS